ncbi:hypothetical protein P5673_013591 [Acropora cervicornis]|uniref:Uncharacterized protein n=1 Tax=Acropora cervicornis TaxID=6130 RepID=A0AAD9QL06_ACRCE|nr:hypothetical protein P5673_013591 [Acropora cervicornis]
MLKKFFPKNSRNTHSFFSDSFEQAIGEGKKEDSNKIRTNREKLQNGCKKRIQRCEPKTHMRDFGIIFAKVQLKSITAKRRQHDIQ